MKWKSKYTYFSLVMLQMAVIALLSSCMRPDAFPAGTVIVCDAEQRNQKGDKFIATNDSTKYFEGGWLQSPLEAHSATHSVLTVPKTKAFALAFKIKGVGPDWYFKLSVWRKSKDGKGSLVAAAANPDLLYLATNTPVEVAENGWEKLELDVYTPPHCAKEVLKFYVWNNGSDSVYFDDMRIERYEKIPYPEFSEAPLSIVIDTSDYLKIGEKRKSAFEGGILQTTDNDWVKGIVFGGGKMMKAKLRLKGDWLDHLWGDKWSYRIKMRKDYSWNHLRTFSVQTPAARAYLMEWVAHKLYQRHDVLTTRYGFIPLIINNEPKGMYAWEEHFEKQLLEWNRRREGPILKFSEDAFWQVQKMNIQHKKWPVFPYYETALIQPFGASRVLENKSIYKQFLIAQKLVHQYKLGLQPPAQIFDIDKLAMYYAVLDLTHARHGMAWHNQRFYYNPVIGKLEPISFDGYTEHLELDFSIKDNMAYATLMLDEHERGLLVDLFCDSLFLAAYLDKLVEVSDSLSVEQFLGSIQTEQQLYDSLLSMEFPYVHFDDQMIRNSAAGIRAYLPELKTFLIPWFTKGAPPIRMKKEVYTDTTVFENSPEFFVNAYAESSVGDSVLVSLFNYFPREVVLLGTGENDKHITHYFGEGWTTGAYSSGLEGIRREIKTDSAARFVFFMFKDRFDTYVIPINPWPYPEGITPAQELFGQIDLTRNPYIERITDGHIFIKNDSLVVSHPFIIPPGYTVHFSAGTILNLIDQAMFISYSPVIMKGHQQKPIRILSSDYTGNGFTVLQAAGQSELDYVQFEMLNTLAYKGWTLTGAVTFYESDVEIKHTAFYRNQCEDALNIIRSHFKVQHCRFDFIYADAFDSDFSTGVVSETNFTNIGNDAIDFSGSEILIKNSQITGANDKGISGGEDSRLIVSKVRIQKANIGIASKDLSSVEVTDTEIEDCNYGLVLLQKKPEYGPASMLIQNTKIINPRQKYLIEKGSKIMWDGELFEGKEEHVAELFY